MKFQPLERGAKIPTGPGYYIIKSKNCISHIGTASNLRNRIRTLIALRTHRGSAEVLCVAYCKKSAPLIGYQITETVAEARKHESRLKKKLGEPPCPRPGNSSCVNGKKLRDDLIFAADPKSYDAGYVQAIFDVGEELYRIVVNARYDYLWKRIGGKPPGPWCDTN